MPSAERHRSLDERFDPAGRVAEYDPAWPARAEAELRRIRSALGAIVVRGEHVGSTAVPGLAGKPIIDLLVAIDAIAPQARFVVPLEQLGYLFASAPESPALHFFALPPARPRTHHVHVCLAGSDDEMRHLAVRDFLRISSTDAEEYEALKRQLAVQHRQDRLAYIAGKEAYVAELEQRALTWRSRLAGA